ncbi:hypothetical protein L3X38_003898 [Prunus dulcis]|uniref:Uncharacterized protein n=1 Tax=Prunus dulcis TaxID=3755 RepID=A0AAD4ZMW8_PRUDU|nr:hypothetical protein L3X38_003898 [Prunus dulcis]
MGWRNAFDNVKPVFVTIYATVIIGIIFSSLYVISAIYSGKSVVDSTTFWLSYVGSPPVEQAPNVSQVQAVPKPSLEPRSMSTRPIWEAPLHTKKMPPLKKFRLSKELVQERVKDNVIIVTFGNYAFMDFILTWVKHLTDLGLSNLLIGAMDTKLLGVPVFDMGSHMSTIDVGWGSPTFHKMGRESIGHSSCF